MKTQTLAFVLVVATLLTTCAKKPTSAESTGNVNGYVNNSRTGVAIENAIVSIQSIGEKITDNSGYFQFNDIEEGSYSIEVEKDGYINQAKQVSINVDETAEIRFQLVKDEPIIAVSPSQINFGNSNTLQTLSIINTGTGSLTWNATESITWLTLSPSSGAVNVGDTSRTEVTISRIGLSQGIYTGDVILTSDGGNDTVQVQMEVMPILNVSETTLNFGSDLSTLTFSISNPGGGKLDWMINNNTGWISILPLSDSTSIETDIVTVLVDRSGLAGGDYTTAITITSNGGNAAINIIMNVPLPPGLLVSPSSLDFGTGSSTMNINIQNSGDGLLSWSITSDQGWLTSTSASGETTIETDQVGIVADRAGLDIGDYSGIITVLSNGGSISLPITLTVVPGPMLTISSTTLDFSASLSNLTLSITNSGTQTLDWNIVDDQDWIDVTPTSGSTTTEQDVITVSVDRSGLAAGDYSGDVTITSNGGDQIVSVTMAVAPELSVTTNVLEYGLISNQLNFNISNAGQGVLTWNIATNQTWISASPTSGTTTSENDEITIIVDRTDMNTGDHTGSVNITSDGGNETIEVTLSVPTPAVLVASPESLDFGTSTTSMAITISNSGDQTLDWNIVDDQDWIDVTPTSGSTTTEQDVITVSVDRSGLAAGDYSGDVTITSNGGDQIVSVTMAVAPELSVTTNVLEYGLISNQLNFNISNAGQGVLTWNIATNQTWISASPTSGTTTSENDEITIIVDRTDMNTGDHTGSVNITSDGGNETIEVTLSVPTPAVLVASPESLDFETSQSSMQFTISNSGDQTLDWNITDDQDWLSVTPTSGSTTSEEDEISVSVDRNGLAAGDYSGDVTITSNGGDQVVSITVAVAPELSVSTNLLEFGLTTNQLAFDIMNAGQGILTWSIATSQTWINVSPTSGTTASEVDPISINVDRTGLSFGDHFGSIIITSDGGNETIEVTLSVPAPAILVVNPESLDFETSQSSMQFTISNSGDQTLDWNITDDQDWLSVTPTSGSTTSEEDEISVSVDRSGLAAGNYNGNVTITSNGGDQVVSVAMDILPPVMQLSSNLLDFGSSEDNQTFTITNSGSGTLNWSIVGDQDWISLWPSAGSTDTEEDEISVTIDRAGLAYDSYTGTLTITSDGGNADVSVSMVVPFHEDFSNLDTWTNDLWVLGSACPDSPCASFYQYGDGNPDIATMYTYVDVVDGQTLSFWTNDSGLEIELYINNNLVWTKSSGDASTISLNGTGNIQIKFVASGSEYLSAYLDEIYIE